MKFFSLPADFKTETLDKYYQCNQNHKDNYSMVIETYGQLTVGNVLNSGRVIEVIPEVDYRKLEHYFNYSREKGIDFDYTLNPACMGNFEFSKAGVKEIKKLLKNLYLMGIRTLTVSIPSLFELVQSTGLDFKIKASAICEIMTPDKALFYKNLGAGKIVVDPDITRDFKRLKRIRQVFGEGVEIIINNVCYKNCPYKMFHYNHEAHRVPGNNDKNVVDYYFNRCSMQKAREFKNMMRVNWIRPEDLKYYKEIGIHYFKIQGRQNVVQGDPVKTLTAYIEESYEGNLYDLITLFAPYTAFQPYIHNKKLDNFIKTFFDNPDFCQNTCSTCGYCEGWAKKCMDPGKTDEINKNALLFFKEEDGYTKLIKKEEPGEPGKNIFQETGLDFEFEDES